MVGLGLWLACCPWIVITSLPHHTPNAAGTFTISNLGMYGVSAFDAILPPGQGSILAIGGSIPTVVVQARAVIVSHPSHRFMDATRRFVHHTPTTPLTPPPQHPISNRRTARSRCRSR